jgi:hypothetical protein
MRADPTTSAPSDVGLNFKGILRTTRYLARKVGRGKMCRFLCYLGPEIFLSDLLYRPRNSLILQSYKSKARKEPLNGDGFGVGWYAPQSSPIPGVFTRVVTKPLVGEA